MYKIGDFAKIALLPISQLRYYDEIGLFSPEYTDVKTGYRYYSTEQLPLLNRILALKDLGLTLQQIKQMVTDQITSDEIRGMLMLRKAQVEQTIMDEIARLKMIEMRLNYLDNEFENIWDVNIKSIPEQHFMSNRRDLPTSEFSQFFGEVGNEMSKFLASPTTSALPLFVIMVHSPPIDTLLDVEFGYYTTKTIETPLTLTSAVTLSHRLLDEVPSMATLLHKGDLTLATMAYQYLGRWVEVNGYQLSGAVRELYLRPVVDSHSPDNMLELQFPVTRAS